MADMMNMTVTTLDLHAGYEVIGAVCGSSLTQTDPDQAFLGAMREIKKSAALLEADAVTGEVIAVDSGQSLIRCADRGSEVA